jgi:hypothetical protein
MRRNVCTTLSPAALVVAGILGLAGCDLDVPDLNNAGLDELQENPTPSAVTSACTGLLIGTRGGTSGAATGYVSQLGTLGRESYNFDPADPRNIGELLEGPLQGASPFGGAHWAVPYGNIRLANIIRNALDRLPEGDLDNSNKAAIRGFANTITAIDLLRVIVTHDTVGGVIDTDREIDDLGPIVSREEVYAEITRLLDDAAAELAEGPDAFPFALTSGFAGFDTPETFIAFNRAIKARVSAYRATIEPDAATEHYNDALDALEGSFLNGEAASVGDLNVGVFYTFSNDTGDGPNALINPNVFAHPSIQTDAQETGSGDPDLRFSRKVVEVEDGGGAGGLTSTLRYDPLYPGPEAPVALIRNEELILLRAEANLGLGNTDEALADINLIRTVSGGLEEVDGLGADELLDELLYNRQYSLLFEGGHRWIDARRFGRIDDLPLDRENHVYNVRYPPPQDECNARPGEPACAIDSRL